MIGDGTCIFEVISKDPRIPLQASFRDLREAAMRLQRECAKPSRVGGIATDIGEVLRFARVCRSSKLTRVGFAKALMVV